MVGRQLKDIKLVGMAAVWAALHATCLGHRHPWTCGLGCGDGADVNLFIKTSRTHRWIKKKRPHTNGRAIFKFVQSLDMFTYMTCNSL